LLADEAVFEPSSSSELAGRALMAPLLGAVGATVAGFLGALVGAVIGVLVTGPSFGGLLVATVFAGGGALLLGAGGMGLGIALGGALFSKDLRTLFSKTVPWAFAATGIAIVIGFIFLAVVPAIAGYLFVGAAVALAVGVPLVVESRRLADAPKAPEPAVTVASF